MADMVNMTTQSPDHDDPIPPSGPVEGPYPVLSNRAMAWAAGALVVIGVGLAVGLLIAFGNGQHSAQLDAIKTAGTIVVGTGGAAALWLTARRQRTTEIGLNQKRIEQQAADRAFEHNRTHQDRVATATETDAESRRITDLYTKAADQLGSDKAPVRLAGLYALERLAQDNAHQRLTIVNVLCAYLRMPYQLPGAAPNADAPTEAHREHRQREQERQVRITAQRILAAHLRPGEGSRPSDCDVLAVLDLDLTGATLIDFTLAHCHLRSAQFDGTRFAGNATFRGTQFADQAQFSGAKFADADFEGATFLRGAQLTRAEFVGTAGFQGALLGGLVWFRWARFCGITWFGGTEFAGPIWFEHAEFRNHTVFGGARFEAMAEFGDAQFHAKLEFNRENPFSGEVDECWVRLDVHESVAQGRSWPQGWIVMPAADRPPGCTDGEWGHLAPEPALAGPQSVVHPDTGDPAPITRPAET